MATTLAMTVLQIGPARWRTPNTRASTAKETTVDTTDTIV